MESSRARPETCVRGPRPTRSGRPCCTERHMTMTCARGPRTPTGVRPTRRRIAPHGSRTSWRKPSLKATSETLYDGATRRRTIRATVTTENGANGGARRRTPTRTKTRLKRAAAFAARPRDTRRRSARKAPTDYYIYFRKVKAHSSITRSLLEGHRIILPPFFKFVPKNHIALLYHDVRARPAVANRRASYETKNHAAWFANILAEAKSRGSVRDPLRWRDPSSYDSSDRHYR
ncbi:hypothetical protein M885DRAFT_550520 [Pelagophyceae sp. CCMP2097]|nr:hypothetical protein M885DRAFT_550520 [Pelagophyceae sp. CCMP2097]